MWRGKNERERMSEVEKVDKSEKEEKEEEPVSKKNKYRKPKPWDTPDIDKWKIEKWNPGFFPFLSFPFLSFPFLSFPFLPFPFISFPSLPFPFQLFSFPSLLSFPSPSSHLPPTEDMQHSLCEESSFACLFPKYREKYIREVWSDVTSALKQFGIDCVLDLIEG